MTFYLLPDFSAAFASRAFFNKCVFPFTYKSERKEKSLAETDSPKQEKKK